MSTYQERRLPPGSKFLKQETAGERGVNTCYITSAVNAAIALQVISIPKAIDARYLTQPHRFPKSLTPNGYGYGYGTDKVEVTLVSRK